MKISREELRDTLGSKMKEGYSYLTYITAVDYVDHVQVLYFIEDLENSNSETIAVDLPADDLNIHSVIGLFHAADWYERELSEMFGINIYGRDCERLLLREWDGKVAPLRKSFVWNTNYETDANGDKN